VQDTDLHTICSITFDNAADNRGVKRGLRVALDQEREERAKKKGVACKPLVEKGCGDHIMSLNQFTSTMYRISRRFGREWKGKWEGFMQWFGLKGKPIRRVTRVRFVSTDRVARQVLKWYAHHCTTITTLVSFYARELDAEGS